MTRWRACPSCRKRGSGPIMPSREVAVPYIGVMRCGTWGCRVVEYDGRPVRAEASGTAKTAQMQKDYWASRKEARVEP